MLNEPTIFVVDDDNVMRDSLRWLLESVNLRVETFASASEFLARYKPTDPGCLVADVRMPGMSGLELQERLTQDEIAIPVILMTGHGDVPMAVRALKSGAVDFLEKPFNDQLLLDRVKHCVELDTERRRQRQERGELMDRLNSLTPREKEILERIVSGNQNKQIANALNISVKTVEVHRANIMNKTGARSLAELVAMHIAAAEDQE